LVYYYVSAFYFATVIIFVAVEVITSTIKNKLNMSKRLHFVSLRFFMPASREIKGELGKIQIYFRKILLHEQNFW